MSKPNTSIRRRPEKTTNCNTVSLSEIKGVWWKHIYCATRADANKTRRKHLRLNSPKTAVQDQLKNNNNNKNILFTNCCWTSLIPCPKHVAENGGRPTDGNKLSTGPGYCRERGIILSALGERKARQQFSPGNMYAQTGQDH